MVAKIESLIIMHTKLNISYVLDVFALEALPGDGTFMRRLELHDHVNCCWGVFISFDSV